MSELNQWFQERNAWVRTAVNKVQEKGDLNEDDYKELVELCIKEAKNDLDDDFEDIEISSSKISLDKIKLKSLKNVEGINALAPKKPLQFGDKDLSIIYGQNGSGKSSYVKILKHICGARHPGKLLSNVFENSETEQKCDVEYEVDGNSKTINWKADNGTIEELSTVDIYDTSSGKIYIDDENEVSYEPPLLELFSNLVEVAGVLSDKIEELLNQKPSRKPSIPTHLEETGFGIRYNELTHEVTEESFNELTKWDDEDQKRLKGLKERLNTESPAEKAKKLADKKRRLDDFVLQTIKHIRELSDSRCSNILELGKKALLKEKSAEAAAKKIFSSAPLEGVGSSVWEQLWEKAREYSESHAYTGEGFPVAQDDSRCVLCHQSLSDDAKERLQSFEDYVTGELKKDAIEKRKEFDKTVESLSKIRDSESIATILEAIGLEDKGKKKQITQLYETLSQRIKKISEVKDLDDLSSLPESWDLLNNARKLSQDFYEESKDYLKDAEEDNRGTLVKERKELEAREWLSNQSEVITEEVSRLKEVHLLNEAKKLTNPVALSRKKGTLAEELITEAFVGRFNQELQVLGASWIKIELAKTRVEKGRVLHKLQLKNAEQQVPDEVLSEGENRIVTLAAFLADVTGEETPAPFVFDDPITSLDEDFEEAAVRRLIELSKDRQVIVFTHRIALIAELENFANKADKKNNLVSIRRIGDTTGNPCNSPIYVRKPKNVLNQLLNERLTYAKKAYKDEIEKDYESEAKSICSDFRILLERMVENVLMADMVQRFRRDLHTNGKIYQLSKINKLDCKYIDDLMSKYSRYEHSQPHRAPVPMPLPDELETDMNELKNWYKEFTNRQVA